MATSPTSLSDKAARPRDWPLYWFARLEQAVEDGDHQTAATAQRELERLGVTVRYGKPVRREVVSNAR